MELFTQIFGTPTPIIGMVHLLPTIGYEKHPGMRELIEHAKREAQALERGGVHGILVENDQDHPHTVTISDDQKACMLEATLAVRQAVGIPVGVDVLLNDWRAALDIANAAEARYIRIDVFVDEVSCEQGVIEPQSQSIVEYRRRIGAGDVALFTDIQVKHKQMVDKKKSLVASATQARDERSDALVVTGMKTGTETALQDLQHVKEALPDAPLLVGSGITAKNVRAQLAIADGAIVGTTFKGKDGLTDPKRVVELMNEVESV